MSDPAGDRVTFIGVRHHSPACARLVRDEIRRLRPAFVLIEGPVEMNGRLGELMLGHRLPIAVFTGYRDARRHHMSWAPLCEYSPEWVALREGHDCGAQVRFIDLPAWHSALAERENRYADAEKRYRHAVDRLCEHFAVDNTDTLWDHLFETGTGDPSAELAAYFDLIRGEDTAAPHDTDREAYMAAWIHAARAHAPDRPIVVVTGGFHRPALMRAVTDHPVTDGGWPDVPEVPVGAVAATYLVPFSFARLDAFGGYQSGMPSPAYYQRLWDEGPEAAAAGIVTAVVSRLRERGVVASTADLIGARTLIGGLARLRGHDVPTRTDVLDGVASALIDDALDHPLPWTGRGAMHPRTHPVVVEVLAALRGDTSGSLHSATPHPPIVADVAAQLGRHHLVLDRGFTVDLSDPASAAAGHLLNRLRVLRIPGFTRLSGPASGTAPVLSESWQLFDSELRLPALIEAGTLGATVLEAATVRLGERFTTVAADPGMLADVLFDAVSCDLTELSDRVLERIAEIIETCGDIPGLGTLLRVTLGLWRTRPDALPARLISAATTRLLWLLEGVRGTALPDDTATLRALVAVRDTALHAQPLLNLARPEVVAVFQRCAFGDRPAALRGAALGMTWALTDTPDPAGTERAIRGARQVDSLGDFLAGLFAVARERVLEPVGADEDGLLTVLDELVGGFTEPDFLAALPALRLAFAWLPPRERATIADHLLRLRGVVGSAPALLRLPAAPELLAHARAVEDRVDALLRRENLLSEVRHD
ncbi:DUF5682 family protein [Nocardia tengchongensis]|uniref:DUF5682 family protein n=1 Tax=Nocardia tengchongensis TaxID=2055889 RepID=UPI0036A2BAC4